jgi:hypothetical protein
MMYFGIRYFASLFFRSLQSPFEVDTRSFDVVAVAVCPVRSFAAFVERVDEVRICSPMAQVEVIQ